VSEVPPLEVRARIVTELGLVTQFDGDRVCGSAPVTPEICYPGTSVVRTSVLLTWADIVAGVAGARATQRVAVTLDLDVHLFHQPVHANEIEATATVVKAGQSISVEEVLFHADGSDTPFALAHATFMSPPGDPIVIEAPEAPMFAERKLLSVPFAERVGVRWLGDGVAEVPRNEEALNPVGSIQGGLVALAAEEAVRAARPDQVLVSLDMRYLRPFREGSAYATARVDHDLARIHIRQGGPDGKLGTIATARIAAVDS
jgi:acyl-coenzyme A thioesterase PaaI-like protein